MPHIWVFLAVGLIVVICAAQGDPLGRRPGRVSGHLHRRVKLQHDSIRPLRAATDGVVLFFGGAAHQLCDQAVAARRQQNTAWISCVAAVVAFQGYQCVNFTNQFRDDSRQRLREWIALNIPQGSVVIEDRYVLLEDRAIRSGSRNRPNCGEHSTPLPGRRRRAEPRGNGGRRRRIRRGGGDEL